MTRLLMRSPAALQGALAEHGRLQQLVQMGVQELLIDDQLFARPTPEDG